MSRTIRVPFVLIALGAGCGSVENDSIDARAIDADDTDRPSDIDATPARCNPTAAFGTPIPMTALNTTPTSEEAAFLSADERTIYFSSTRPGGVGSFDLWFATRNDTSQPFANAQLLGGAVNTMGSERRPVVSGDGLYLYASTYANDYNVSVSRRADTSSTFGMFMSVAELNPGALHDGDPYLMPDHTIYWATDDVSVGDIYRATWNGSSFRPFERLTGYDTAGTDLEASPVVTPDELTMYFQSARTGGSGGYDIWMTTRSSTVAAFGMPVNQAALNSGNIDVPDWISADNCILYMHRNVGAVGGPTDYDLFYAVRGM